MATEAVSVFRENASIDHFDLRKSDEDLRAVFLLKRGRAIWCACHEQCINKMQTTLFCTGFQAISVWILIRRLWKLTALETDKLCPRPEKLFHAPRLYWGYLYPLCLWLCFLLLNRLPVAQMNVTDTKPLTTIGE